MFAACLLAAGLGGFALAVGRWADVGFGPLNEPFVPRLVIVSLTLVTVAIQSAFSAFLFGIFDIPVKE